MKGQKSAFLGKSKVVLKRSPPRDRSGNSDPHFWANLRLPRKRGDQETAEAPKEDHSTSRTKMSDTLTVAAAETVHVERHAHGE